MDALPAVGPNRGDSQHGDGAARSITFWFRSLEAQSSLEGGFIAVQKTELRPLLTPLDGSAIELFWRPLSTMMVDN